MTPTHNIKASTRSKHFKTKKKEAKNVEQSLTETQLNSLKNAFNHPDSEELLKKFSDSEKTAFLKYVKKKYATLDEQGNIDKDMFNETEQSEAIRLKLAEPEASPQSGSWLDMVANAFSSIPKGLVLGLMASEALKSVGAFPTEYNPNHQSAESPENSDVVHHRIARGVQQDEVRGDVNLENQNCVRVMTKTYTNANYDRVTELRAKCFNEPCNNQWFASYDTDYFLETKSQFYWVALYQNAPETADIKFSTMGTAKVDPYGKTITYSCKTPAYSLVQDAKDLVAKGNLSAALEKYQAALDLRDGYSLALEGKAKVLAELAKTTTAEPSSSTSNEASSTTTTTEAVTIAKNTAQAKPFMAPQDQTTPSNEEWTVKGIVGTAVSSGAAILTALAVAGVLYKKGGNIYNACLKYLSKSDPEFKDCNEHGVFESDQFILSNDNGDAKVTQDSSVLLAGAENIVTSEL
ncbi:hypothetical protein [Candidatus Tisiphia endosymbiont of Ptychoptera albimana]|uniref:hypothetical protein n=1 Tax=Candidatus Tisiphia endosymbiont of Ptychoptera albimana TaxID=3066260 RepID=UPI00312C9D58